MTNDQLPTKRVTTTEVDSVAAGRMVRGARKRAGLSLREVAAFLDVSKSFLCLLEAGHRDWSAERFERALWFVAQQVSLKEPHKTSNHRTKE